LYVARDGMVYRRPVVITCWAVKYFYVAIWILSAEKRQTTDGKKQISSHPVNELYWNLSKCCSSSPLLLFYKSVSIRRLNSFLGEHLYTQIMSAQ